jgi:hypothetical protein
LLPPCIDHCDIPSLAHLAPRYADIDSRSFNHAAANQSMSDFNYASMYDPFDGKATTWPLVITKDVKLHEAARYGPPLPVSIHDDTSRSRWLGHKDMEHVARLCSVARLNHEGARVSNQHDITQIPAAIAFYFNQLRSLPITTCNDTLQYMKDPVKMRDLLKPLIHQHHTLTQSISQLHSHVWLDVGIGEAKTPLTFSVTQTFATPLMIGLRQQLESTLKGLELIIANASIATSHLNMLTSLKDDEIASLGDLLRHHNANIGMPPDILLRCNARWYQFLMKWQRLKHDYINEVSRIYNICYPSSNDIPDKLCHGDKATAGHDVKAWLALVDKEPSLITYSVNGESDQTSSTKGEGITRSLWTQAYVTNRAGGSRRSMIVDQLDMPHDIIERTLKRVRLDRRTGRVYSIIVGVMHHKSWQYFP